MRQFLVLVPVDDAIARFIDPGSAIVADGESLISSPDGPHVDVFYEGNRYNADNLQRYEDRLMIAGGRLAARYPTIAKARLPLAGFMAVGYLRVSDWSFTVIPGMESAIERWVCPNWRRPADEQLSVDIRNWERASGKTLAHSLMRLDAGDYSSMTPLMRDWVNTYMRRRAGVGR